MSTGNKSRIVVLASSGKNGYKIAKELDVSQQYVSRICIESGIHLKPGRRIALTPADENTLVDFCLKMDHINTGLSWPILQTVLREYVEKCEFPCGDGSQAKFTVSWLAGFLRRHKNKLSHRLTHLYSPKSNKQGIDSAISDYFFGRLKEVFEACSTDGTVEGVLPEQIYNLGETSTAFGGGIKKVLALTGKKNVKTACKGKDRDRVTVIACVLPSEAVRIPLTFLYRGKNVMPDWSADVSPSRRGNVQFMVNASGWNDPPTFLKWLREVFVPKLTVFPVSLFLDGHYSHMGSLAIMEYCLENQIYLVIFPSNCTGLLQPLDVGVFGPFKKQLNHQFDRIRFNNKIGETITKTQHVKIVETAWRNGVTAATIVNTFRAVGLFPFNPAAVKHLQMVPEFDGQQRTQGMPASQEARDRIQDELKKAGWTDSEIRVTLVRAGYIEKNIPSSSQKLAETFGQLCGERGQCLRDIRENSEQLVQMCRGASVTLRKVLADRFEISKKDTEAKVTRAKRDTSCGGFLDFEMLESFEDFEILDEEFLERITEELEMENIEPVRTDTLELEISLQEDTRCTDPSQQPVPASLPSSGFSPSSAGPVLAVSQAENCGSRKRKQERFTKQQAEILEASYLQFSHPSASAVEELAASLSVTTNRVRNWLANRRRPKRVKVTQPTEDQTKKFDSTAHEINDEDFIDMTS